jgi:hypothetical protein
MSTQRRAVGSRLQTRLLERARRLDPDYGRRRVGIRPHVWEAGPAPRRGGLPVVGPEFWRQVSLVSVRGRRYSPGVGSLVREAMRKTWFGKQPKPADIAA